MKCVSLIIALTLYFGNRFNPNLKFGRAHSVEEESMLEKSVFFRTICSASSVMFESKDKVRLAFLLSVLLRLTVK